VINLGSAASEWVHIGRLAELGPAKEVHLGLDQEHVLAIVGKRGSGKSFTLGSVLEGLCTSKPNTSISRISKSRAALLFDTLNIFQWMVASIGRQVTDSEHVAEQERLLREWRVDPVDLDVDLWVPAGYEAAGTRRAQPFRIRTWDMEAADWAALLGVDAVQDTLGQLITQVTDKVARRGWRRDSGEWVSPIREYAISDLLDCLSADAEIAVDYAPQSIRAVRQRLAAYEATPLFGSQGTPLNQLLRPGRLSVLLLSGVPDDVRLVSIYLTLRKLVQARAQASEVAKAVQLGFGDDPEERGRMQEILSAAPPKTWVVIDEAQNVFPSERQTTASDTLLRFVREGRNFGLSLAFTTQQPTALDARVMAQVDTFLVHTLTVQRDIAAVLTSLKAREPEQMLLKGRVVSLADSIRSLGVGQAFVSSVDSERSLFMDVRPRVSVHGGFEG
jgi:DNA helicase HerA-like ATPase